MRRILTSSDAKFMGNLYQYLRQHSIPVSVSEQGEKLELWLHQSSYEAVAKQLIADFKENPQTVNVKTNKSPKFAPNLLRNTGWLTRIVAVVTLLVYILLQISPDAVLNGLRVSHLYDTLPFAQPWRFLSPVVLHFSLMHLVFNLFWWWYLGGRVESHLGSSWLLAVLLFSGVTANLIQYWFSGPNFGGLSGVVYGLLGFCWIYSLGRRTELSLPAGLIFFMLGWLALGYTGVLWVDIANEAHLAGLLSGCLAGFIVRILNPTPKARLY
ncbi:MAG: rhomboid family intramembrane serine protease [Pseudomonadota bacterium]